MPNEVFNAWHSDAMTGVDFARIFFGVSRSSHSKADVIKKGVEILQAATLTLGQACVPAADVYCPRSDINDRSR